MKKFLALLFCSGSLFLATGYKETTRIIKLSKDGSGVIHVRVLLNPQLMEEDSVYFMDKVLEQRAKYFGEGVRYIAGKDATGANGWKGYIAKYAFTDINKLKIRSNSELPAVELELNALDEPTGELLEEEGAEEDIDQDADAEEDVDQDDLDENLDEELDEEENLDEEEFE